MTNMNIEFIKELCRGMPKGAMPYVTQFASPCDDATLSSGARRGLWKGYGVSKKEFVPNKPNCNNFVVVSSFFPDESGEVKRRKAQFASLGAIMIDDVGAGEGSKIKPEDIPLTPTAIIETSLGNYQYWYFFDKPILDRDYAERLIQSFIDKGLTSDGSDPGMSAVTRYARLPLGTNNKVKYSRPFEHNLSQWDPTSRFTPQELIEGFEVTLSEPKKKVEIVSGDPEQIARASTVLESIKALGFYQDETDDGVYAINCPWGSEHTGGDMSGTAYFEPSAENNYLGGFKCHHGHCQDKTLGHFLQYVENCIGKKFNLDGNRSTAQEDFAITTANPSATVAPNPVTQFARDKNGKIEPTQINLLTLLSRYQLRYDNFRATYMGAFDGVVRVLDEADYTRIQLVAEQIGFKRISKDMIRDNVMMVCMDNEFDSAIEWGNSLVWDGVERCHELLVKYFGATESPYVNAASMYIASAMGGRLMFPGCKADAAIVLVGNQGAGKTVSIQSLAPMEDTFVEISLHNRDSDLSRHLRGKLIGELAELRGLKSKESEDIKAWMSRTTEEWIPKYMEFTKTFKRRLTFWGSTNDTQFLNDVTGNRRWLPVTVGNPNPDLIKNDCIQIWAEAIQIYKKHGILWEVVQKLADEVRESYFDEDPFVEDVRNFLELKSAITTFSSKEIWNNISSSLGEFDTRASSKLKRAMTQLGWEHTKVRRGTQTMRGYQKK